MYFLFLYNLYVLWLRQEREGKYIRISFNSKYKSVCTCVFSEGKRDKFLAVKKGKVDVPCVALRTCIYLGLDKERVGSIAELHRIASMERK